MSVPPSGVGVWAAVGAFTKLGLIAQQGGGLNAEDAPTLPGTGNP